MDEPLIRADPGVVKHRIAAEVLATPALTTELGDIRLVPHQVDAARRLLSLLDHEGGALLADVTGMGKTYVALAVARATGNTMIVAPAALRRMWQDALRRTRVVARVESYEALSRGPVSPPFRPSLLILDEAHHARNPRSRRYQALADLAWGARVLLLSATPIHNRAADLQALLALFLGSGAYGLRSDWRRYLVRRSAAGTLALDGSGAIASLPALSPPRWHAIAPDEETFRAIRALPPAVPPSDGGVAHGLMLLGLIRAWCSSTTALRATLRRRLQRCVALLGAIEGGRHPTRAELASWIAIDDAVQLAFPDLVSQVSAPGSVGWLLNAIQAHEHGIRRILSGLKDETRDSERAAHLMAIRRGAAGDPVVAFTQFTETAIAMYRACSPGGGVALVTGKGARIASGRVTTSQVVAGFDVGAADDPRMPMDLLVASDVLSEGLSLRRVRVLVHLDLPWTMARLEQRVGRIRRLGSPHRQVDVHAIGPPVGVRALTTVVRALQRKSRLTAVLGGAPTSNEQPIAGIRLCRATRLVVGRTDTEATERIRSVLTTWLDPSPHRDDAMDTMESLVGCLALPRQAGGNPWQALAVVNRPGRTLLLAASPDGVTERPADVLAVLDRVSTASTVGAACTSSAVAGFRAVLDAWLERCRAGSMIAPVTDAPSTAHAAVLRVLDGVVHGAARAEAPVVRAAVERCRAAVLASRGVGAEHALERWLGALGPGAGGVELAESLTRMLLARQPRWVGVPIGAAEGASMIAALVMVAA
jgi:superfamily II DNA or RNA helicase